MTPTNKRITSTIVSNFLIIVGAGHGIGTLGLIAFLWLPNILTGEFRLVFFGEYEESLASNAVLSLIGQICLLISLFISKTKLTKVLILAGLTFMLVSYISLTHTISFSSVASISMFTGIPFIISTSILLFRIFQQKDAM